MNKRPISEAPRPPAWFAALVVGVYGLLIFHTVQGRISWGQLVIACLVGGVVVSIWAVIRYRDYRP